MDAQTLWIVVLSVATPVAGVVGFSIQLRQVTRSRLENEKLRLEIEVLREQAAASERQLVRPTNQEILNISYPDMPMFSRSGQSEATTGVAKHGPLRDALVVAAVLVGVGLLVVYFVYDVFRFVEWVGKYI